MDHQRAPSISQHVRTEARTHGRAGSRLRASVPEQQPQHSMSHAMLNHAHTNQNSASLQRHAKAVSAAPRNEQDEGRLANRWHNDVGTQDNTTLPPAPRLTEACSRCPP